MGTTQPQRSKGLGTKLRTCLSLCLFLVLTGFAFKGNATDSKTTTLDFDGLAQGELLTNQFAAQGVVFSGTSEPTIGTSGLIATQGTLGTVFFGNSEPNFVIVGLGSLTASFLDPSTGNPVRISRVSMRIGDGDSAPEIVGINAFDAGGGLIFSQVVHLVEQGTTVEVSSPFGRIVKIRVFAVRPPEGSGFNIDDFAYRPMGRR